MSSPVLVTSPMMPSSGAALADRYGQAMPLWLAAAGTGLVFVAPLGMNEGDLRE
jgi:hypothetical protein